MDQTRTEQVSSIAPVAGLDFWKALDLRNAILVE